jgi:uncharacterized protein (DUF305 family)
MSAKLKATIAAAAAGIALAAGIVGFAIARGTDDHADGARAGDVPAHVARHMGPGPRWSGPMMDMGAMPGMGVRGGRMSMDEAAFLAMMIPHHEMALDMAEVAIRRGSDPEVRDLAERIAADQRAEIDWMRDRYRAWFGGEVPRMPMSGAMAMMGMGMDAAALEATAEPDRAFLAMMVPHHAGAILMADMALAAEPRAEVAGLARRIIATQAAEIGEMQAMRERIAPPHG